VFLDEPTAGLDPEAVVALRTDIASLAREHGATVFLNTHNLTDAEKLSRRTSSTPSRAASIARCPSVRPFVISVTYDARRAIKLLPAPANPLALVIGVAMLLAIADVVLFVLAWARFRRETLLTSV
jgi:hypothetical protein